jgi:hypothetical protein
MGRIAVVAALAAVSMLAVPAAAPAASRATSPPTTFADPAGDSGTAADITSIAVSNDDQGQYTFDVAFGTPYGDAAYFDLYLDTDMNSSTGDASQGGADYGVEENQTSSRFFVYKWDGGQWAPVSVATASVVLGSGGMGITISINRSELGGSGGFHFIAYSGEGDGTEGHYDDVPSGSGMLTYTLKPTFALSLGGSSPGTPKAGKQWVVVVVVKRSDTGTSVGPEGTLTCAGSSGATKLATSAQAFVSPGNGKGTAAICGFTIPKSLKHKTVSATVSVSLGGQTFKKVFSARVT